MALKMVTILVIIARHVPWVNLLCLGLRTLRPDITPLYDTYSEQLAEQQPVGRWVELKQEPVSPSSD